MNSAREQVFDTLVNQGFQRDSSFTAGDRYTGKISVGERVVSIAVEVLNWDFIVPPKIQLTKKKSELPDLVVNVERGDYLCFADPDTFLLDRYNPGGEILKCIEQAKKVLARSVEGNAEDDLVREFPVYWGGEVVLSDIDFDSQKQLRLSRFQDDNAQCMGRLLTNVASTDKFFSDVFHSRGWTKKPFDAKIIHLRQNLTLPPSAKRIRKLSGLIEWLELLDKNASDEFISVMGSFGGQTPIIIISAANAVIGVGLQSPKAYRDKQEFRVRSGAMSRALLAASKSVDVTRYSLVQANSDATVRRNLVQTGDLLGKRICIIGCGTIGSHLAKFAVQSGAGGGGGELVLLDTQDHLPQNIGRHLLGYEFLGQKKAESTRDYLKSSYPGREIKAFSVEGVTFVEKSNGLDLIVDATGEEAVSRALNERARGIESATKTLPPVLYVYLFGNGAAAQALFAGDEGKACFKCLEVGFGGLRKYMPMRNEAIEPDLIPATCSDGAYIPYSVGSSVIAAGLALEMMLEWASSRERKYLRTRLIDTDPARTKYVKDVSPIKSEGCPCCSWSV